MRIQNETLNRRSWGKLLGASCLAAALPQGARSETVSRPKVAAIFSELRFRSHAYNILENFLFGPYLFNGKSIDPGVDVVALYADQFPSDDMAREASRKLKIPLYKSIDSALCRGGDSLAVDAVVSIVEHGDYPYNELGQQLYPRKEFFDQAFAVMKRAGRFVPFFNDKHWSYRWDWAKEIFDTARKHKMPILAGSSVPLAQRVPPLELPANAVIEEAVAIHGGGFEVYDFHGLEILQSIVEGRRGGETGVAKVQFLHGESYNEARRTQRWTESLVAAALEAERQLNANFRRQRRPPLGVTAEKPLAEKERRSIENRPKPPHAIHLEYRDGLRGSVLRLEPGGSDRWAFACKLRGEDQPRATAFFNSPWGNRGLFKALSHSIQRLCIEQREPYPAERTLLTTGILDAVIRSRAAEMKPIDTPHLKIAYEPGDWKRFREMGDTWKIITADTPQPTTFGPP